ncbi:MAG: hypothetical protein H0U00_00715 [Actinobacteria bacterium]|nr:hypothetical protein [Actinomycetota bacterium]
MSEDVGAQQAPDEEIEDFGARKGTEPDEQVVGDDESDYGGAGQSDAGNADHVAPGSGQNHPASEQDEDQGI